ncbi:MAG TPA: phosphoribosylformylglycinamidine synthase subunit PurL [Bacteroidetes bacterium]|nr:phosphoribosylformylglycinamidine synthase subunit PurL [Bacteroidota bacterium]
MSQKLVEKPATLEQAQQLGLLPEEFDKICEILDRTPNFTELSIFSVMWSEHCSYKNSIIQLKKLPKESPKVLAGAGEENAGLMDIGDGLAVCFKIESHNHPSAIEPYQGAATGVGGIHRDIFSMGARPIACLNSLRFGSLDLPKTKHLVKGIVKGIGDYGNAFGVATVGGEIYFDDCYNTNPLVNAMSVGIVKHGETASATSEGVGNPVFIVGSRTGKDGIHGATFASGDITEDSVNDLPSVQVGDPFQEKLLLEATLELIQTETVVGIQDMGAAGITCSTSEMSAKGECGMDVWLHKVPTRQADMKPFEILLSESQERMLVVLHKGKEAPAIEIFEKWDLECAQIGVVTKGDTLRYFMNDDVVAEMPAGPLVLGGGAPVYTREQSFPSYIMDIEKYHIDNVPEPENLWDVMEFLVGLPSIASKHWVTQQYDSMVGTDNMASNRPGDAAVVRIKGTKKALAITTDCNSRYVKVDPFAGTALAVAEAARNIACSGGVPLGITNCLNFGNPYNPVVYWQFANAIQGMKAACKAFGTPVTGGNVSFYNQSADDGPVDPTPTIGMVGLLENADQEMMSMDFKHEGDLIYLMGTVVEDINSSEYLYRYHKVELSPAPYVNLEEEVKLGKALHKVISAGLLESAHDISEGGLATALLESSFPRDLGFNILLDDEFRHDAFLFGESGGRAIVSVTLKNQDDFETMMEDTGVTLLVLGDVTEGNIDVDDEDFGHVSEYKEKYMNVLEEMLG